MDSPSQPRITALGQKRLRNIASSRVSIASA
jgi:hypothetical protein